MFHETPNGPEMNSRDEVQAGPDFARVRPAPAWRAEGRPDCGARRPQHPSPNTTHILWAANPARSWGLGRSLVLNATDEPLCVVPSRRAVVLVLKAKAEIVSANGEAYHSEKLRLPVPSVVRLTYFVKVPYRARATLSRRAVFIRDGDECQYS